MVVPHVLLPIIVLLALVLPGLAQVPAATPLRVALTGSAPFVSSQDGVRQGLSIEVWEKVAEANTWQFAYTDYPDPVKALAAVKNGDIDVVVGDVGIVSPLFSTVEFSQPYFRAGLQIMISEARPNTFAKVFEELYALLLFKPFWYFLGVVALSTVLVTLFERKHNPDFPKTKRDGLGEAFYYVISMSLGKSGYKGFGGWFGRLVMIFWIIVGVIVVAFVNGSVTSVMTAEKLSSGHINGPQDLVGKTVGVITDSTADFYLSRHGSNVRGYPNLESAVQGLLKGEVVAVVDSAPLLQYYDNNHQNIPITEVGPIFEPYNFGFALQIGSPLRAPLNSALLKLQESGVLKSIGERYFGDVFQP